MLTSFGQPDQLTVRVDSLIDATFDEIQRMEAPVTTSLAARPVVPAEAAARAPNEEGLSRREGADTTVKTIGLCMIVKNEAAVIRRCLDSVRPLLDYVVIEDTGSTDRTQEIIRGWLKENGLSGEVFDEPWRDFAHNRSVALAKLRENPAIDYALIMDADDVMQYGPDFDAIRLKSGLSADHYQVTIRLGGVNYGRAQICSNHKAYYYRGVLHEFLEGPEPNMSSNTAEGLLIVAGVEGARSRDPEKYQRDAATLERALATETDAFMRSRYTFYLAQSYRDSGQTEKAIEHYLRRADLGFWDDEIYVSLCRAAQLQATAERPADEVLATWRRAIKIRPGRAEAIHGIAHFCRTHGRNEEGFQIAKLSLPLTEAAPPVGLFIETWVYEYALLDEYAINAYWSGHYRECLDASLRILSHPSCPEGYRKRVLDNAKFAAAKLPAAPNLGPLGEENLVQQHALVPPRQLRSPDVGPARVLVAILAKQKEPSLPLYLECIEALVYPKSSIVLYIRTNNNTDGTERILREWVARVGHLYAAVEFDAEDVAARVEQFGVHEWNATRFRVLGRIRNISLRRALEHDCDFYFVADIDNFVRPCTLHELMVLNLPIVAPLLRSIDPGTFYSNYHAEVDKNGYYQGCDQYHWILNRWIRGVVEVAVVHCTYLIRADVIDDLTYQDETNRYEYVVFSDSARKAGVPQYLDNRQVYGYITFDVGDDHYVEGGIEQARALLEIDRGRTPTLDSPANLNVGPKAGARKEPPAAKSATACVGAEVRIREKFSEIYQINEWGCGSGVGSLPINNVQYMEFLQTFIKQAQIRSVVDFGCGDWQFSRFIDWNGADYVGVDLVHELIEGNRRVFAHSGVTFEVFDSIGSLPNADLLLCKDVFQHLPNELIAEYLAAFKQKFKYLLITNDDQPDDLVNGQIQAGGWRPVRLDRPPFSEAAPVILSWTITWGGWKPTHKSACLVNGRVESELPIRPAIIVGAEEPSKTRSLIASEDLDMLHQVHLINLDRSKDRLTSFVERNAHLKTISRVSAVDGLLVDQQELIKEGIITEDLDYKRGALGCALSHVGLWKKAATQDRIVTIFEDDVICSHDFPRKSPQILSGLPPDWDVIHWGFNFNPLFLWVDLGFSKANLRFYDSRFSTDCQQFQSMGFGSVAAKLIHSYGLLAYSVSPKGARALLEKCLPLRKRLIPFPGTEVVADNTGIDCAMSGAYGSMQAFVCIPPLVIHDDAAASDRLSVDTGS